MQQSPPLLRETGQFGLAHRRRPCLATVLVGDDPSSHTYVRMKRSRCAEVGMESRYVELPADTTTAGLVAEIESLSADPTVDGILLQHPVPDHINERAAFEAITPGKDVDGVTMHSYAAMAFNENGFHSCTPGGIIRLLDAYGVPIAGQHAVVVGRSPILGKPVGMLLLARDATVTSCHSRTPNLADHVRGADIVIAAVGRPELIRGEWVKEGAVVIDAGQHRRRRLRRRSRAGPIHHTCSRRGRPDDDRGSARADPRSGEVGPLRVTAAQSGRLHEDRPNWLAAQP